MKEVDIETMFPARIGDLDRIWCAFNGAPCLLTCQSPNNLSALGGKQKYISMKSEGIKLLLKL